MKYCNRIACLNPAKWELISNIFYEPGRQCFCRFCVDEVQGIVNDVVSCLNGMSDDKEYSVVVREI